MDKWLVWSVFFVLLLGLKWNLNYVDASAPGSQVELPTEGFYTRPGLEDLPRINYEKMVWVNVCDYGAVGDGVTFANEAFDRALAALPPEGGVIYIPAGIYNFGPPASPSQAFWEPRINNKPLKNVHFVGEGEGTVLRFIKGRAQAGEAMPYCIRFREAENISICNLRFDIRPYLDQRWPPLKPLYPMGFNGVQGVQVIGVIIDQAGMGLSFWSCRDVWVIDCEIRNTGVDGIHFANCVNTVAAYNYLENLGDDGIAAISTIDELNDTRSVNNRFIYNTVLESVWGRGITVGGDRCHVEGNWLEQLVMAGIFVNSGGQTGSFGDGHRVTDAVIKDNVVVRANLSERDDNRNPGGRYGGAINLVHEVERVLVVGNQIYGGEADGIRLRNHLVGSNLLFTDNVISHNLGRGFVCSLSGDSNLQGLVLSGNLLWANASGALFIGGNVTDVDLADNVISMSPAGGRPVVVEGFQVPVGGVTVAETGPTYVDVYLKARTASLMSGWQPLPMLDLLTPEVVLNLRDYGAVGDGQTNDTWAFLAALKSLPDGGLLFIPEGEYLLEPVVGEDEFPFTKIRHHLVLYERKNLIIQGAGTGKTTLIFTSAEHQGWRFINVQNVSLRGFTMALTQRPDYRKNRALLDVVACTGVQITDLMVQDAGGPGIRLDASDQVLIRDCTVKNAMTNGVNILASREVTIENTEITDSFDHGIYLSYHGGIARLPQYIRLKNNRILGTENGFGIAVATGDWVEVVDNYIKGTYQAGVMLYQHHGLFWPGSILVKGNHLQNVGSGEHTITLGAISIVRCRSGAFEIIDNVIDGTPFNGLWLDSNVTINSLALSNNQFLNVGGQIYSFGPDQGETIEYLRLPWRLQVEATQRVPAGVAMVLPVEVQGEAEGVTLVVMIQGQSVPVVEEEPGKFKVYLPRITKQVSAMVTAMDRYGSKQEKLVALEPVGGSIVPVEEELVATAGETVTLRVQFLGADHLPISGPDIPRVTLVDGWNIHVFQDPDNDGVATVVLPRVSRGEYRYILRATDGDYGTAEIRLRVQ
ncbi:MAG TPA: hypothetical protein GXX57_00095 [Firmicutes bacterium]|nr:hypothetical protein [Bacillota bacterium]